MNKFKRSFTSISFRRMFLNQCLEKYNRHIKGNCLDVGGFKNNDRYFVKYKHVESVEYLNNDISVNPDHFLDVYDMNKINKDYDTILMMEVIEYLDDPKEIIQKIYALLKPSGKLIISYPFLYSLHGDFQNDNYRFTKQFITNIIDKKKFNILKQEINGSLGSVIFDFLRSLILSKKRKYSIQMLILRLVRPLFYLIDIIYRNANEKISTGFFIILEKKD